MADIKPAQIENFEFSIKLAKQLALAENETNLFLSSASITVALGMCYFGTVGETKKEMKEKLFGMKTTDDEIKSWIESVLALTLESNEEFTLKFANRSYVNQDFQIKEEYAQLVAEHFKSETLKVNFAQEGGRITDEINNWVAKITNNRITDLVPHGILGASTILMLINALYFKGLWDDPFPEANTKKQNFYSTMHNVIEIDMMNMIERKPWFENDQVQMLELGYANTSASMILLLPKEKNGLKKLVATMNGQKLKQLLDSMATRQVYMEIPKFKIEQSFNLNEALKHFGIEKAFDHRADFSGMIDRSNNKFCISDVFHKAFIEVDEQGTEAAAATFVKVMLMCMPTPDPEPRRFLADHPFLFLLTAGNHNDKTILFIGQFFGKDAS